MMTVRFMSFKYNYAPSRIKRATSKEIIKASYEAFFGLLIPIIIVGGIRFGVFTPTEAGAIAVAYSATDFMFSAIPFGATGLVKVGWGVRRELYVGIFTIELLLYVPM